MLHVWDQASITVPIGANIKKTQKLNEQKSSIFSSVTHVVRSLLPLLCTGGGRAIVPLSLLPPSN